MASSEDSLNQPSLSTMDENTIPEAQHESACGDKEPTLPNPDTPETDLNSESDPHVSLSNVLKNNEIPPDSSSKCSPNAVVDELPRGVSACDSPGHTEVVMNAVSVDGSNQTPMVQESSCSNPQDQSLVDSPEQPTLSTTAFPSGYRSVVPYSDSDESEDSEDSSSSSLSSSSSSDSTSGNISDSEACDDSKKVKQCEKELNQLPVVKAPGELDIEDLPPIEELQISVPDEQVEEIGKILHTVDTLVVVEAYKEFPPLDIDSVLFLEKGARTLGRIFDVIGPVKEPLYCVRFNSKEHIESHHLIPGMLVYCAPKTEHSQFVFVQKLLMMKGSDASWMKDAEVPSTLRDFSDDDDEASSRRKARERSTLEENEVPKSKYSRQECNSQNEHSTRSVRGTARGGFRPRNPRPGCGSMTTASPSPCQQSIPSLANWQSHRQSFNWQNSYNRPPYRSQYPVFGQRPDLRAVTQRPLYMSNNYSCQYHGNEFSQGSGFNQNPMPSQSNIYCSAQPSQGIPNFSHGCNSHIPWHVPGYYAGHFCPPSSECQFTPSGGLPNHTRPSNGNQHDFPR